MLLLGELPGNSLGDPPTEPLPKVGGMWMLFHTPVALPGGVVYTQVANASLLSGLGVLGEWQEIQLA